MKIKVCSLETIKATNLILDHHYFSKTVSDLPKN